MVITINPGARDEFNNLSTLNISYSRGRILTPNRFVSRHDLNAKNKLGADIPLSRTSKITIIQEIIDAKILESLLQVNGFLATMKYKLGKYVDRTNTAKPLTLIYPFVTKDALSHVDTQQSTVDFYRFFCDLAVELGLEAVVLPIISDVESARKIAETKNLQLIPILNLRHATNILKTQLDYCRGKESDIPIIAFKFYSFASANLGYNLVMDQLENIHEGNQATMFVDVNRILPANILDISAPHYGSFFFADLIAEKYGLKIPRRDAAGKVIEQPTPRSVKIFCKNNLVTTDLNKRLIESDKFDLDIEKENFSSDRKLQDLFVRVVGENTNPTDWLQNKPWYLSRIHENIQTRAEFSQFQKDINGNLARDYLVQKPDMNKVVTRHMQFRHSS